MVCNRNDPILGLFGAPRPIRGEIDATPYHLQDVAVSRIVGEEHKALAPVDGAGELPLDHPLEQSA